MTTYKKMITRACFCTDCLYARLLRAVRYFDWPVVAVWAIVVLPVVFLYWQLGRMAISTH